MPQLKVLQESFSKAIYNGKSELLSSAVKQSKIDNKERIEIYKNNVLITLHETLKNLYPAICKLVGEDFFKYAAGECIKKNNPKGGNLDDYGQSFIDFISNFSPAKEFPYLSDVAKLEWALHAAYFAADAGAINKEELSKTSPDKLEIIKFKLHPSSYLIRSEFPINKIWEITQNDYNGDSAIDIKSKGDDILVIRPEFNIHTIKLGLGEYELLKALTRGQTLGKAFENAVKENNSFDIGNALQKFTLNGTFVSFSM